MKEIDAGKELKSLNNLIMRFIENKMLPSECDKITVNNGWIIGYLFENRGRDVFSRDLEREFSVTRSTVSKVVEVMESKGLVRRESVSYDARLKKLVLTEKAEAYAAKMHHTGKKFEEILLRGFSEDEKHQLMSFLIRMKCNLENPEREDNGE